MNCCQHPHFFCEISSLTSISTESATLRSIKVTNANAMCPSLKDLGGDFNVPSQLSVNQRFSVPLFSPLLPFFPLVTTVCYLVKALHVHQLSLISERCVGGVSENILIGKGISSFSARFVDVGCKCHRLTFCCHALKCPLVDIVCSFK